MISLKLPLVASDDPVWINPVHIVTVLPHMMYDDHCVVQCVNRQTFEVKRTASEVAAEWDTALARFAVAMIANAPLI